jgi:hypothetical protein
MKKLLQLSLLVLLTTVGVPISKALNVKANSLENLLKVHLLDDTIRINLLNKIATFILMMQTKGGIMLLRQVNWPTN